MAPPKGNQFWMLRSEHGRDTLFASAELMWQAACEYFTWCEKNPFKATEVSAGKKITVNKVRPFTMEGLCQYLRCNTHYFQQFNPPDDDFSYIVTRIKEVVYNQKFSNAASGLLNANIIAYDLGLRKDKDVNVNTVNAIDNEKLDKLTEAINNAAKTR